MHFELPRRRPKAIQVRAHLGVQKWHAPKLTSRSYKSPFWTFFVLIWKGNFIELPTAPAPHQNSIRVNGNCRNKWTSRICQGAARPSFGPFACESCWSTQGRVQGSHPQPSPRIFSSRHHIRVRSFVQFQFFIKKLSSFIIAVTSSPFTVNQGLRSILVIHHCGDQSFVFRA